MAFAVLFRIHYWDDGVARRLSRLRASAQGGAVFVVPDETRGPVAVPAGHRVFVVRDVEAAEMGFVAHPDGGVFYHNADYPVYLFARAHPEFDRYVLCEHDVDVRADVGRLCAEVEGRGIDLLAMPNRIGAEGWSSMADTCVEVFGPDQIRPHLVCFCILSRRAVAHLASRRLDQSARYRSGDLTRWPYCEGFVASQLIRDGFLVEDLSSHVSTARYDSWPPYHEREVGAADEGAIVHPVLAGDRYVANLLRFQLFDILSWFDARSELNRKLAFEPASRTLPRVGLQMLAEGHVQAFLMLIGTVDPRSLVNLGACFPSVDVERSAPAGAGASPAAWQSSIGEWSAGRTREEDATRALDASPSGRYAFHTAREINPWWTCDLGSVRRVNGLTVENRGDAESGRASGLRLFIGVDARHWVEVPIDRAGLEAFAGSAAPLAMAWDVGIAARFVRLEQSGLNFFHLDRVEVRHSAFDGAELDMAQVHSTLSIAALRSTNFHVA